MPLNKKNMLRHLLNWGDIQTQFILVIENRTYTNPVTQTSITSKWVLRRFCTIELNILTKFKF